MRRQGGPRLVGQRHRNLEPLGPGPAVRHGPHHEVAHHCAEGPHGKRDLGRARPRRGGETAEPVHDGHGGRQRLGAELARPGPEDLLELLGDRPDEHGHVRAGRQQRRHLAHPAEVGAGRSLGVPGTGGAGRQLAGEQAHHHQRDRGCHVALLHHGEALVGGRVEEGEGDRRADGGTNHRGAPPGGAGRGGDHHQRQSDDDVAVTAAERHPQHGDGRRRCRRDHERNECRPTPSGRSVATRAGGDGTVQSAHDPSIRSGQRPSRGARRALHRAPAPAGQRAQYRYVSGL